MAVLWSMATVACAFTGNYAQLFRTYKEGWVRISSDGFAEDRGL